MHNIPSARILSNSRPPSAAPLHPREVDRLTSLCDLAACDRGTDPTLDGIARQAAAMCDAPFGLVTLVRESDQIYLGNSGVNGSSTSRDEAICAHTILEEGAFVVEDISRDPRFSSLPIAAPPHNLRFYAGTAFHDHNGLPLGSVCVLDIRPRTLEMRSLLTLQRLAAMVGVVLETRRFAVELLASNARSAAVDRALARLDDILAPLVDSSNGFRPIAS